MVSIARLQPGYRRGFAPRDGVSLYPQLHKGLIHYYVPGRGNTGNLLRDGRNNRFPGVFNSTTLPVWDKTTNVQGSQHVLNWTSDIANTYINCGDITDFQFQHDRPWTTVSCGQLNDSANQHSIVAHWGNESFQGRQFLIRTTAADPAGMQVFINGSLAFTAPAVSPVGDWLLWATVNDGTGASGGLDFRVYNAVGALLDATAGQAASTDIVLTTSVELWGRTNADPMFGLGGPVYFYNRALVDAELRIIAADSLAPVRLALGFVGMPVVSAGGTILKRFATMQGGIGANLTTGNMSGGMNA